MSDQTIGVLIKQYFRCHPGCRFGVQITSWPIEYSCNGRIMCVQSRSFPQNLLSIQKNKRIGSFLHKWETFFFFHGCHEGIYGSVMVVGFGERRVVSVVGVGYFFFLFVSDSAGLGWGQTRGLNVGKKIHCESRLGELWMTRTFARNSKGV